MHGFERIGRVTVHEGFQRHELGKLTAENLGVAAEVVDHTMRRLLILSEVATLEKAVGIGGRVHEEVRGPVQLNDNAAKLVRVAVVVLQINRFNGRERVLDLVASLLIVDVVGHSALVGRVEDDEVHGVLAHTRPLANTEGAASQVVDH